MLSDNSLCYIVGTMKWSGAVRLCLVVVLVVVVAITSVACPPRTTPGTTTPPPTTQPPGTATPPVTPATGNINLSAIDPYTLDPALSSEAVSHEYILQLYSGLVALGDDLNPVPDIASGWKLDATGKVYTFTLRKGVKFHDGREVNAADFKYSWERACQPQLGSLTAATYLSDIVGAEDVLAGKAKEISGVKVIDDYTLEVTIDAPRPYFLYKIGYVTAFVVDRNAVARGPEWWRQPNGTGPFKMKEWKESESFVLEWNPDYYGEKAKVATVTFKLLAGVPMRMYETGEIDATGVGAAYIDMATDEVGPFAKELSTIPELSFSYVGFNAAEPPFDDPNVRRAFSLAIDREKLVSLLFKDTVAPAFGILPPGMPGYNAQLKGLKFDPEAAKAALKASRYGDASQLPPITITTSGYGAQVANTLEAIVHEWRTNLGVEVKVRQLEPERFFYSLRAEKDQMFDIGWIADYPHPQDFLEVLFRSGGDNNWGEYQSAEVDALLDTAGLEPDVQKAMGLYQQVEQKLVDDAACLPLWFGKNYVLAKSYLRGYAPTPMGFVKLSKVSVNK